MRTLIIIVVAVILGLWSFRPVPGAERSGASAALLETDRRFATAARDGDMQKVFNFWTDDAVNFMQGAPPARGKEAIHELVKKNRSRPGFSIHWEPTEAVVAQSGELGYTMGMFEMSFQDKQGNTHPRRGSYVCIWRKQPNGDWKCAVECSIFSSQSGRPKSVGK